MSESTFNFGVELCKALGVDHHNALRVEIIVEPANITTVRVSSCERDEQGRLVVTGEGECLAISRLVRTWRQQVGDPVIERSPREGQLRLEQAEAELQRVLHVIDTAVHELGGPCDLAAGA